MGAQPARRRAASEERILCCSSPTLKRPCATSQVTDSKATGFLDQLQPRRQPNRLGCRAARLLKSRQVIRPAAGAAVEGAFSRLLNRAKTKQAGRRAQSCPERNSAAFVGDGNSQRDLTEFTVPAGKITATCRAGDHPSLVYPFATFVKRRRSTSWRRDAPTASA